MRYLLDSNTFIQAHKTYYKMNFCSAYWDWMDGQFEKAKLSSIEFVQKEILRMNDELSNWVKDRKQFFLSQSDHPTQAAFSAVANQVMSYGDHFIPGAQQEFLQCADPWLIAKALGMSEDVTIVTHETFDAKIKKKVKLPNICKDFNVSYINTYQLLETLNAKFVLG